MARAPLRVLFCCTGVGILNRGIESFFREAFDHLHAVPGLEARLLKGAGAPSKQERVVRCIPRTSALATAIGALARRNAYVAEQWSSFLPVAREIRRLRPEVVFYSDANLGFLLYRFRHWIGVPCRLLFSNGGPCRPPFVRLDFVHQVNPVCLAEALQAGEPPAKHVMVPYGLRIGAPPVSDHAARRALRERLALPLDRPVVLSVGWISRAHKRLDYVVEEVASLPAPRPFLMLLGAMDGARRTSSASPGSASAPTASRPARCRTIRSRPTTPRPTVSCSPRSPKASAASSSRRSPMACR